MGLMKRLSQTARRAQTNAGKQKNLPFEISLLSLSEADKYERRKNKERVSQFNENVTTWSIHATSRLKQNVRAMIKRDHKLSESIRANLYYDRQYAKEVVRVGFSFAREGIYMHKGAGHGQGGYKGGSEWYNLRGELKSTKLSSLMKMGTGNRKPKEWFDPIIEQELPKLADIVADYSADLQIDATSIYLD